MPARRDRRDGSAPPAAPHGLPNGRRRRPADPDRSGASAPEPAEHRDLCPPRRRTASWAGRAMADGGAAMSRLDAQLGDYLRLRRALGYRLEREEQWLRQLVEYLQAAGSDSVTSELTIRWARLPATAQPRHWAQRLGCARKVARYPHPLDSSTPLPPIRVV